MNQKKYLFIDRDGTVLVEPEDKQIDSLEKLDFLPGVFAALTRFQAAGYELVMVSNQDGLGTDAFPQAQFDRPHEMMLKILGSQGINFSAIHVCPHVPAENCECRKPKVALLMDYLVSQTIDKTNSYVIGDRESDIELAKQLGIAGIQIGSTVTPDWQAIVHQILDKPRCAQVMRETKETQICITVDLDQSGSVDIETGIAFFDHMLEQVIKHAGMSASIKVQGDLEVDDHHSVEDTAIALGEALAKALGDKRGIARYGFVLPMDEAEAAVSLDLSGRAYCRFDAELNRDQIGGLALEMVPHFFQSLAASLQASLHIKVSGENTHHKIEAAFKGLGRVLAQAIKREHDAIPSTKGVL